jgi:hypothetical protein
MRRRDLVLLGFGVITGPGARAGDMPAAQLIMLERHDCPWCRRWLREVGEAAWNASDLGLRAPLRRVDVAKDMPADLGAFARWRFTPTFVLMQGGRELGRIIGYQGDLFFWQQAEALLAKLPQPDTEYREESQ